MGRTLSRWSRRLALAAPILCGAWALPLPQGAMPPARHAVERTAYHAATEQERLQASLSRLAEAFPGDVAIAVQRVDADWTVSVNGDKAMPQQSVSKLWVTLAILAAADRGELSLDETVTIHKDELSIFYQPIRKLVGEAGYTTTLHDLIRRALQQSDNAANDALVRRLGGPFAVEVAVVGRNLDGVRYGPGERTMQTAAAGLTWKPEYSFGRAFWEDREALPQEKRKAALQGYLADPPDGATALGIVGALARLHRGTLLSPDSTALMLDTMAGSVTGAGRMRAGLAPGWRMAHKTGTGQVMGSLATGYNDVGLVTAPDGRVYAVAVLIGATRQPLKARQALMSAVTGLISGASAPATGDGTADEEAAPDAL